MGALCWTALHASHKTVHTHPNAPRSSHEDVDDSVDYVTITDRAAARATVRPALITTRSSRHVPWESGIGDSGSRHGPSSNVEPTVHKQQEAGAVRRRRHSTFKSLNTTAHREWVVHSPHNPQLTPRALGE